jgi:hypothetical protein
MRQHVRTQERSIDMSQFADLARRSAPLSAPDPHEHCTAIALCAEGSDE